MPRYTRQHYTILIGALWVDSNHLSLPLHSTLPIGRRPRSGRAYAGWSRTRSFAVYNCALCHCAMDAGESFILKPLFVVEVKKG